MLTACNGNEQDETSAIGYGPLAGDNVSDTDSDTTSTSDEDLAAGINAKSEKTGQCWQTEVIDVLYNIMGKVALETYRKMTGGAFALSMICFALWMSWRLLKQLSSFKEETMGEVWTEIAKMFFMCLICGLIASQVKSLATSKSLPFLVA